MAMPTPAQSAANLFELEGDKIKVTYSTTSISGKPQFDFHQGRKSLHFSGSEIQTGKTPIGSLITVTIENQPDSKRILFSLLVPDVNLPPSNKASIKTIGILTTAKTTIGGPNLVKGAIQTYKTVSLSGTAKFVTF
jgi:hypothetical protein